MGRLRHLGTGEVFTLPERLMIGRSRVCTIRLGEADVSGEHALLRWTGAAWELQDLHSRNGTFLDGRRLAPGGRMALRPGSRLGIARVDTLVLADAAPPALFAAPLDGGPPVEAHGGILALPGPSTPTLMIFRARDHWLCERGGEAATVVDGEVLRLGRESWRLHLPEPLPQTAEAPGVAPDIENITLRFRVSRDEEYVEVVALHGAQEIDLKARSHHYMLLTLARARQRDLALPADCQGWVYQRELLDMMRVDVGYLHLNVYRLRQQFGEAGIASAARIVERRTGTRQLRIGVARLVIDGLGDGVRPSS